MLEKKVMELENAISIADNSITKKFVDMAEKAGDVSGRKTLSNARCHKGGHNIEHGQVALVETMNALTAAINSKIEQVEQLLLSRLTPAPTPTSPVPPIPPSFGGHQPPTTTPQHFNVGSPLSAPPGISSEVAPDPWAQYTGSSSAPANSTSPLFGSQLTRDFSRGHSGPVEPQPKHFDERSWSIAHAKVSKELKPFTGVDSNYRAWANRIKDHFREVNAD